MFTLSIVTSTLGYVIYAACQNIAQYMVPTSPLLTSSTNSTRWPAFLKPLGRPATPSPSRYSWRT